MNDYAGNIKITLKNSIEITCKYVKLNNDTIDYKTSKNEPLKTIKKSQIETVEKIYKLL